MRPFSDSAGVQCRGYSQALQRAITDFGADVAFGHMGEKLKEHYGIEVPTTSARRITEAHGEKMLEGRRLETQLPAEPGVALLIAEMDGSMIPVVETARAEGDSAQSDRRRTRQLGWKEARLSLARPEGSVSARYAATLGSPEEAGSQWRDAVIRVGAGSQTRLHCLGDGASWIAEQVERQFGTAAHYLVDFYHLCDYLTAAAPACAPSHPQAWLEQQKQHLKGNRTEEVLDALCPFLERVKGPQAPAPVAACYRDIENRPGQFDYQGAIQAGLPIGSGEVESAHRHVVQQRLKLSGAWWKLDNAEKMLALRVTRANQEWETYWQDSSTYSELDCQYPKAA